MVGMQIHGDQCMIVFNLYDGSLEDIHWKLKKRLPKELKKTLSEPKVRTEYWWSLDEIKFFAIEILKGLQFIHSKLIIHLDLKASNILVKLKKLPQNQKPVVTSLAIHDFGSSEVLEKPNQKIQIFGGTKTHMAPEVKKMNPKLASEQDQDLQGFF